MAEYSSRDSTEDADEVMLADCHHPEEQCCFKHCNVNTRGTTAELATFYMRQHQRQVATLHPGRSHGYSTMILPPQTNPLYLIEEYCGVTVGRNVDRMTAVDAAEILQRGATLNARHCHQVCTALQRAKRRAVKWGEHYETRAEDIKEYLVWQLMAIAEELDWYYGSRDTKDLKEKVNRSLGSFVKDRPRLIDEGRQEVASMTDLMLDRGRFFPGVDEDDGEHASVSRKRRRVE